jgi:hypothetical protein
MPVQSRLFDEDATRGIRTASAFRDALTSFRWRDRTTKLETLTAFNLPVLTNEFWTSQQRAAHSLHEVSYRACFKPQLPLFFISRLTVAGETVYDPFAGRGTTLLEAALQDRVPRGCDVNPLSRALAWPRLSPPTITAIRARLDSLSFDSTAVPEDLLAFYHRETLQQICALRAYLLERQNAGSIDAVDDWLRMVTLNRLTGHSPGFLSVYTLPPNQAVTVEAQRKINTRRQQEPPRRDLRAILLRKSASLLADLEAGDRGRLQAAAARGRFQTGSCLEQFWEADSVRLIVTSPPFLDVVDYATDNWLRAWFIGLDARDLAISVHKRIDNWRRFIGEAFVQFRRLLSPLGFVAFEVGEVRGGRLRLEDEVIPCGIAAGLSPVCVVVNQQSFTKTANIWGVRNNAKGTNTNRIVVFQKLDP